MYFNLKTLLAVAAATLAVLPSVGSAPIETNIDIASEKRNNNVNNAVERGVLNDVYSVINQLRGITPKPKTARPKEGSDAPKTGKNPGDSGTNPAIAQSRKCARELNGRCSDEEESDIDMDDASEPDDPHLEDLGWTAYSEKGKQASADANAKIAKVKSNPAGNPDKTPPKWNVDEGGSYKVEELPSQTPGWAYFETVPTIFRDLGLDKSKTIYKGAKTRAVDAGGNSKLVGENYISRSEDAASGQPGSIVAKWNDMKENNIATNKVQWTDLQFGALNKVRGTDNMKDIKYIIREAIDNDGTINAIKTAHQRYPNNFNANGKGTFDLSKPNDVDAAVTIEGTRNGNAAPFWLKDYTKAFGIQAIKKVHVWDQVPGGSTFDGEKTSGIAFELGPA